MKILVTGKDGQIGWELARCLLPLGEVVALDRTQIDLSKPETIPAIIANVRPHVIVNAAAYTAVDKAEEEDEQATIINGAAVGALADEAKKQNALLIHYSTDYVFDGTKETPYTEVDKPNPINAYGRGKLAGEIAIRQSDCDYLILRTSWVYSTRGNNFLKTIIRLAREREELRIVADQYGSPTWARNIADVTAHLLRKVQQERQTNSFVSGTYNLNSSGKTTWHGFASAIIAQAKKLDSNGCIKTQVVMPIASEEYPLPAPRPKNSQLDSSAVMTRFGLSMPEWHDAMKLCIDEALTDL